jgi:uncharacterized metal-binding protein
MSYQTGIGGGTNSPKENQVEVVLICDHLEIVARLNVPASADGFWYHELAALSHIGRHKYDYHTSSPRPAQLLCSVNEDERAFWPAPPAKGAGALPGPGAALRQASRSCCATHGLVCRSTNERRNFPLICVKARLGAAAYLGRMNESASLEPSLPGQPAPASSKPAPLAGCPQPAQPLTVVYACSGCSDAGELADHTARALAQAKLAEMSCLAGIGGRVKSLMRKAEVAQDILVIDGCPLNCAKNTLELAGIKHFRHLELHRLGLRKGACPPTPERLELTTRAAAELIRKDLDLRQGVAAEQPLTCAHE